VAYWGISVGGGVSIIMALVLDDYRKYYVWKVMSTMFATVVVVPEGIHWNYMTNLTLLFRALVIRIIRTAGVSMLRMMNRLEHGRDHHHSVHHRELSA
jgi:hypothetical protein